MTLQGVLPSLRRVLAAKGYENVADGELLRRFVRERDEAAFELLVWRHGRMVLRICGRLLRDTHEAEDAFQATFLTLARRADSIRRQEVVAGWLHKVAWRVALEAKARRQRRREIEQPLGQPIPDNTQDPAGQAARHDWQRVLDQEIQRLGEPYRLPFVLCHLEGKTNAQAARELGCPVGTIESRLTRARQLLRARLTRQGLAPCLSLPALPWAGASLSAVLVGQTAKIAAFFAHGMEVPAGIVSPKVLSLAEGALRTMLFFKIKVAGTVVLLLLGLSAGWFHRPAMAQDKGISKQRQAGGAAKPKDGHATETVQMGTLEKIDLAQGILVLQETSPLVPGVLMATLPINSTTNLFNLPQYHFPPFQIVPQQPDWSSVLQPQVSVYKWNLVQQPVLWTYQNISQAPILGGTVTWSMQNMEVRRPLASAVSVVIDGTEAKLGDLIPKISVTVTLNKNGQVRRIEANGQSLEDCRVDSLDPVQQRLTVTQGGQSHQYDVRPETEVLINGIKSQWGQLKPEMPVSLRLSALGPKVLRVRALGPVVECILKGVDAEHARVTIGLKNEHITVPDLAVARGARVTIEGHDARLVDLLSRVGKPISIRMDADPESNRVVGLNYRSPSAGK